MNGLAIALAVIGLVLGTLLVGWFGFDPIAREILSVGAWGFAIFCGWQLITMAILGVAWRVVAPMAGSRLLGPFIGGRMVRDSAGACLPFSPLGGFVFGVRATTLTGIGWSVAALSLVVDLTAEFIAEIAFAMAGLVVLLGRSTNPTLTGPIVIGFAVAAVVGMGTIVLRKWAVPTFVKFGRRLLGQQFARAGTSETITDEELANLYGDTRRMALATAMHLAGWFAKGIGNWIAFKLLGSNIDLVGALAIEALLHALLIPAFVVPGYAGIQEAGYAGIGAVFGIPPEISLGVSLLRRARDITIGIPILLVWQFFEVRHLRKAGS